MKYASFWTIAPDQILENENSSYGSSERSHAQRMAEELAAGGQDTRVARLKTLEHDLPTTDPHFSEDQVFESERWCVIITRR